MKLLALDIGSTTAAIVSEPPAPLITMLWDCSIRVGESTGMRFLRFRSQLRKILGEDALPAVVAYERPRGLFKSGGANEAIWGLIAELEAEIAQRPTINLAAINPTELKRYATGKGNANKDAMLAAAQAEWPERAVTDHNVADALFIQKWAQEEFGDVTVALTPLIELGSLLADGGGA